MSDTTQPASVMTSAPVHGFTDLMSSGAAFNQTWRLSQLMANSGLVPKHFANKPEACFVALVQAVELQENPIVLMQNMFIVHGMPGFSTKYMIARANKSGIFKGRINWRIEDNGKRKIGNREYRDLRVTAYAILADTGEEVSISVDLDMANGEGWLKNDKYSSMPEVMYRYRSAALLLRLYAPETLLSSYSAEDLETMPYPGAIDAEVQVTPAPKPATAHDALGLSRRPALDVDATPARDLAAEAARMNDRELVEVDLSALPNVLEEFKARIGDPYDLVEECGGVRTKDLAQQDENVQRLVLARMNDELGLND